MTSGRHNAALALLLLGAGACTTDFFVGPSAGSSSSTSGEGTTQDPSGAPTTSLSTTGDGVSTDSDPTGLDSTTEVATTLTSTSEPPPQTTSSSGSTETTSSETTETIQDCAFEAPGCEEAFPECLWNGRECLVNPCNVGGEVQCAEEAPECTFIEGGCLPNPCFEEAECTPLTPKDCEVAPGCTIELEECFAIGCIPCELIELPAECNEQFNCTYNEKLEACVD